MKFILPICLAAAIVSQVVAQTYQESGGLVVMEIENSPSALGLWQKQTSLTGHTGSGYLQFLGNNYETGPATSPLEFSFKINQAGLYYLHLHCAKQTEDGRTDVANDCYVRVEGDYNAGPGPYTSNGDNASLTLLQSDTKYYGGATNSWKWENGEGSGAGNLDPGGDNNKRVAVYDFKAGKTYKLVVSGRSKFFRINRLMFRHTSVSATTAQNLSNPESGLGGTGSQIILKATTDFATINGGAVPYYKDTTRGALAIDASNTAYRDKFASATAPFSGAAGTYTATILAMGETDGECSFRFLVNGTSVGTKQNGRVTGDYGIQQHSFANVTIPVGATIGVESNDVSNGLIPEGSGFAYARGRWTTLILTPNTGPAAITGELKRWHPVTLGLDGPGTSEFANPNPFLDYQFDVLFSHPGSGLSYRVPGFYAADGNAGETSKDSGNQWRASFSPDQTGTWNYQVVFRSGTNAAISAPDTGTPVTPYHGMAGSFNIAETDKSAPDFRARGRLQYVNKHHLRFKGDATYFLKAGPDSPENLLAYDDFDNTPNTGSQRKSWSPHQQDHVTGNPSWQGGKGTELIGAVNYIASEGLNSMSFLTYSYNGDDKNVFPHRTAGTFNRMDCSKLDQWNVIFTHMQNKGIHLHFKTQEQENDQDLDGGALGNNRKLYYRELVARFGHHLALNWNLGEETTNTDAQRKDFAQWFYDNDPYRHHVVVHTFPDKQSEVYAPLLGNNSKVTGTSIQTHKDDVFADTRTWRNQSAATPRPWVIANDEQGPAGEGIKTDANDAAHNAERGNVLWGNLMAGGAGVESYFGYQQLPSDLTCEDFRSRDLWWDQNRHALAFFKTHNVPFQDMANADNLVSGAGNNANHCLALPGSQYVIYLRSGGSHTLNLGAATGDFALHWYNPRSGGALITGGTLTAGSTVNLGPPPSQTTSDWIAFVTNGTTGGGGTTDPDTVTLAPSHDAFLENGTRFNIADLRIENNAPTRTRIGYLQFTVPTLSSTPSAANLILTEGTDFSNGSMTLRAYAGASNNWTETNLSTANAPAKGNQLATFTGNITDGSTVTFNVASFVTGPGTYSFVIEADTSTLDVAFASKESSPAPRLELTVPASQPNQAPVFNGYTSTTVRNTPLTLSHSAILTAASDPDNDPLTLVPANGPTTAGGSVTMTATTLTYTPPAGFVGADTYPLTVSDGKGGLDTGNLSLTVTMPVLGSSVLTSDASDADVKSDGAVLSTAITLLPGRSGTSPGVDRASVLVFQLPELGPVQNPFTSVTLQYNLTSINLSPPDVDLYGLGRRSSPTVLGTDYYGENSTPDPTDATLIESIILTNTTPIGDKTYSSAALDSYFNAQYDGGSGAGSFVFLRFNTSAVPGHTNRYGIMASEGGVATDPEISYTFTAPPDYFDWLAGYPLPPGANPSLRADIDGDGLDNYTEYVFGLNPVNGTSNSAIRQTLDRGTSSFIYQRRKPSLSGIASFDIETSTNLSHWIKDATAIQSAVTQGSNEVVTVTLSPGLNAAASLFVRVAARP